MTSVTFRLVKLGGHCHRQWSRSYVSSQGFRKAFFSSYLGNCYLGTPVDKLHHILYLAFVGCYEQAFWKHRDHILLAHELEQKGFQVSSVQKQRLGISLSSMQAGEAGPQLSGWWRYCYAILRTCGSENNTAISKVSETAALQQLLPECSSSHRFGRGSQKTLVVSWRHRTSVAMQRDVDISTFSTCPHSASLGQKSLNFLSFGLTRICVALFHSLPPSQAPRL